MYYTYILRCKDNSVYTGIAVDLEKRMNEHFSKSKVCAKYTKSHIPEKIECAWKSKNKSLASKLEFNIKKLKKSEKEDIIKNNNLKKYLDEKIDCKEYRRDNINVKKINNKIINN